MRDSVRWLGLACGLLAATVFAGESCRIGFDIGSSGIRAGVSDSSVTTRTDIDFIGPLLAGGGLDETATIAALRELPKQGGFPTDCVRVGGGFSAWRIALREDPDKLAGILAFRNVAPECKPVLLEPLVDLEVWTPEHYLGAVMGDLSSRRGQILGSEPDEHLLRLRAVVPEAELFKYATQLHSLTHGRGTYKYAFRQYAEVPPDVAAKIVEEHEMEKKEEKEE